MPWAVLSQGMGRGRGTAGEKEDNHFVLFLRKLALSSPLLSSPLLSSPRLTVDCMVDFETGAHASFLLCAKPTGLNLAKKMSPCPKKILLAEVGSRQRFGATPPRWFRVTSYAS